MAKANRRIVPHPTQFSASVVLRMLDEDGFKSFCNNYQDHLYVRKYMAATDHDRAIAIEYKKGALLAELVKKHKMSYAKINSAINRVARENYMKV